MTASAFRARAKAPSSSCSCSSVIDLFISLAATFGSSTGRCRGQASPPREAWARTGRLRHAIENCVRTGSYGQDEMASRQGAGPEAHSIDDDLAGRPRIRAIVVEVLSDLIERIREGLAWLQGRIEEALEELGRAMRLEIARRIEK